MNQTIKDATVKRFHCETDHELRSHLLNFVSACNFVKPFKIRTLYEFIGMAWTNQPERFTINPLQNIPGLNSYTLQNKNHIDFPV